MTKHDNLFRRSAVEAGIQAVRQTKFPARRYNQIKIRMLRGAGQLRTQS